MHIGIKNNYKKNLHSFTFKHILQKKMNFDLTTSKKKNK